jgi:hypothetical protein
LSCFSVGAEPLHPTPRRHLSATDSIRKRDFTTQRSLFSIVVSVLTLLLLFILASTGQTVPARQDPESGRTRQRRHSSRRRPLRLLTTTATWKSSPHFVDDVEFYPDQGGVALGKAALTDTVKKNICGKTTRELVPGTLHTYYKKGYGALEVGGSPLPSSRP